MTESSSDREREFDRIVHQYYQAVESGRQLDPQELFALYPEFTSELKSFLADLQYLDATEFAGDFSSVPDDSSDLVQPHSVVQYIGEYRILDEIARGGMGVVYRARQESLRRIVALKMILSGRFAAPIDVERFRREARAAAGLQHANIVRVYEVGEYQGHHYYTMEFIEGTNLTDKLREGSLPPLEAAKLVEVLARTLHYAHQQGVLHRDLKPGNVLIDGAGKPYVTDFGLAKPMNEAREDCSLDELTRTGQILGTPGYMPPEQAAAKHRLIGETSDTYSLGAILYACLGGRAPFFAESFVETIRQVIERDPLPIRTLNPRVPVDLATICHKCLEKSPARRYGTAEELAEELARFCEGKPILTRPISRAERTRRWCRRQPAAAGLIAALVALALAGTWFGIRNQQFLTAERQMRQQTEGLLYAADLQLAQRAWNVNDVIQTRRIVQHYEGRHDLKNFEWYYWNHLLETPQRQIAPPDKAYGLGALTYNPDGSRLAATSNHPTQGTVTIWDAESGSHVRTIEETDHRFNSVAWHPDGIRIATSRPDNVIQIWDSASGAELVTIGEPQDLYTSLPIFEPKNSRPDDPVKSRNLTFSSDGNYLAAPGEKNSVQVWESSTGQPVHRFEGHKSMALSVAFSHDGQWLASSSLDGSVIIWDVRNRAPWATIPVATSPHIGIVFDFHPVERLLAIGTESPHQIQLYDIDKRRTIRTLSPAASASSLDSSLRSRGVDGLEFDPDGSRLLVANSDRTITLWDVAGGKELYSLKGHSTGIRSITFSPTGEEFASTGAEDIRIWNSRISQDPLILRKSPAVAAHRTMHACAISPDLHYVAGCAPSKATGQGVTEHQQPEDIVVWDLAINQLVYSLPGHSDRIQWLQFTADGSHLISASRDWANISASQRHWEVIVWALADGTQLRKFKLLEDQAKFESIAVSPDGNRLAHAIGHTVELIDPLTGNALETLPRRVTPVVAVNWLGDDKLFVLQMSQRISIWDISGSATLLREFHIPQYGPTMLSSPDQKIIAVAASRDGVAKDRGEVAINRDEVAIIDVATGEILVWLKGHASNVTSLAFSGDSRRLATASTDGTVRIWDTGSGREVLSFPGKFDSLAFSRDSRTLIAGGRDGLVVWQTRRLGN